MQTIKKIKNLKGKTVLLRVDFNVPIKDGAILDDFRIKKAVPTVKYLEQKGANIILITHLGKDGSDSLEPVIKRFFKVSKCSKDKVSFFENVRKFDGEKKNDILFAKELAKNGDIYVNDAFSVSHRKHASIVGLPKYLPSYAGFQLEEEIKNLSKALKNIKHPFIFILGGAKFDTKMPLIKRYLKLADNVFVGGALLNDFLKTKGFEVGNSLVDDTKIPANILNNKKLILPIDVIVEDSGILKNKKIQDISKDDYILDVGIESVKMLEPYIKKSKLILWNGPLGRYEHKGDQASKKILNFCAKSNATTIIGGGDIVSVVSKLKMESKLSFVSTGGGATLDFLANGTLPGIKALK